MARAPRASHFPCPKNIARWVALVFFMLATPARAVEQCALLQQAVTQLEFEGVSATAEETIVELLPRRPPAVYSRAELAEFERRLNNLGIFDAVGVVCHGVRLKVGVREKWTLVPEVHFASGKTLADSYAMFGMTEYNFLGTANQLSVSGYRERRGFGMSVGFNEHDYRRRAWSLNGAASIASAALRFEESGWRTTSVALELSARSPPFLHEYFNYIAGLYASRESVYDVRGVTPPPSTQVVQSFMGFSWDAYEWNDLVPRGLQASAWLSIGGLFGQAQPEPRHTAEFVLQGALRLGSHSALIARANAALGTRGNANYGFVLGSVGGGVRGLRDATYYNWAQVVSNAELRQSFQVLPRWALQAVAFCDTAAFEEMTVQGARGDRHLALAAGLGFRVVPTWISSIVLRVDGSRLIAPESAWFTQVGLNQYF